MNILQAIWQVITYLCVGVFDGLLYTLKWIGKLYGAFSGAFWIVLSLIWFALVYIFDGLNWINDHWYQLKALVSGNVTDLGSQIPGPLEQAFGIANTFVPLTEIFGAVGFFFSIWTLCVTIRIIKSWLPTVSG
jgi:phage-related protein